MVPLATCLLRFLSIVFNAFSSCAGDISTRFTWNPFCANTWQIPLPIVPAPITETDVIISNKYLVAKVIQKKSALPHGFCLKNYIEKLRFIQTIKALNFINFFLSNFLKTFLYDKTIPGLHCIFCCYLICYRMWAILCGSRLKTCTTSV